jgi:hypothetical protein
VTSHGGVLVEALGVRVLLATTDEALAAALREVWHACLATGDALPDVTVPVSGRTREEALEHATQQVTERAVSARAGDLLMLHAAAVADERGHAVLLVGPSGMGKTTVARTLGCRWRYVTDEACAIDSGGQLLAYPKPLSVKTGSAPKQQRSPESLGLTPADSSASPVGVLLLDRGSQDDTLDVEPLRTVPAVALLAEHTSYLTQLQRPLHRLADLVHAVGGARRVRYGEATDLEPVVAEALEASG